MQYVSIMICGGIQSGAIHTDLESCLQRCAEGIFGEVPDGDSDQSEEWSLIEKELIDGGWVRFEDGSIFIAKVET